MNTWKSPPSIYISSLFNKILLITWHFQNSLIEHKVTRTELIWTFPIFGQQAHL